MKDLDLFRISSLEGDGVFFAVRIQAAAVSER